MNIIVGKASIPFDGKKAAWLLPDGPNQTNRYVRNYDEAVAYAKKMDKLISEAGK